MKYLPATFVLLALMMWGAGIARADKAVSKSEALKAIELFEKDPSSREGLAAGSTIMAFAKNSDTVHISLSKAVVPWMKGPDVTDADTRNMLLTAYVAGDVLSQLKSGRSQDDVYSGWEQMLTTYAQLLRINSAAKINEVEELKDKEADGKLRAYAVEVQQR